MPAERKHWQWPGIPATAGCGSEGRSTGAPPPYHPAVCSARVPAAVVALYRAMTDPAVPPSKEGMPLTQPERVFSGKSHHVIMSGLLVARNEPWKARKCSPQPLTHWCCP